MATWYGMIRCASAEMNSRLVSTPRSSSPPSSVSSTPGSMTTPLPITLFTPGGQDSRRDQVQGELLAVGQHDGVSGIVAALVADHPLHPLAVQVGRLTLALVAPLGADEDHHRHGTLPQDRGCVACT